jgi:hypothetical protein
MRCTTCRTQLHDWFDTQGAEPMPPAVSEHVRDCSDCKSFIKKWNSVEVGLQSVRETGAMPSQDFAVALKARLAREERRRRIRIPFPTLPNLHMGRVALAAMAILLIALAVKFSGNLRSLVLRGPAMAVHRTPDHRDDVKPVISPDLPIATGNQ